MVQYDDVAAFEAAIHQIANEKQIYIAGAGVRGIILGRYLNNLHINWKGYVDKRDFDGIDINGKKVNPYPSKVDENVVYLLSAKELADSIERDLLKRGVREKDILILKGETAYLELVNRALYNDADEKWISRLRTFKDKYKGKRCFVIGNGPSLRIEDLNKLYHEFTFATNSIFFLYKDTKWRPTFYVTHDEEMEYNVLKDRQKWQGVIGEKNCKAAFTSTLSRAFYYRDTWKIDNLFFYRRFPLMENETPFSDDCAKWIYSSGTVAYAMIQLAIYMGFSTIYLLGIDNSFTREKRLDGSICENQGLDHHEAMVIDKDIVNDVFYERNICPEVDRMTIGYMAAKKYADDNKIKIFNATRGGKLEVFERVDFDSLFSNC